MCNNFIGDFPDLWKPSCVENRLIKQKNDDDVTAAAVCVFQTVLTMCLMSLSMSLLREETLTSDKPSGKRGRVTSVKMILCDAGVFTCNCE